MRCITLQIIDGADRGRVYDELPLPVTIGREEGNAIQLNDERVSRFHIKIQEDLDKLVLTDLDSTNGTKVNGEDIRLRILRPGDLISLGRSVLIFGSRQQIAERLRSLRGGDDERTQSPEDEAGEGEGGESAASLDYELNWSDHPQLDNPLHELVPPELPARLSPGQAAQLAELLEYLHIRIRHLLQTATVDDGAEHVKLDQREWQNLLDLQARLAGYLRTIGEPST